MANQFRSIFFNNKKSKEINLSHRFSLAKLASSFERVPTFSYFVKVTILLPKTIILWQNYLPCYFSWYRQLVPGNVWFSYQKENGKPFLEKL